MAVAVDAASSANSNSNAATSLSWSHTCTGNTRLLLVAVHLRIAATESVSGITYNGVAMTLVSALTNGAVRLELWQLVAPATGANTIAVTLSAGTRVCGGALSLTGVDPTIPLGTAATNSATNATPGVTVASGIGEVVVDALSQGAQPTETAGTGQTRQWFDASTAGVNNVRGAGSTIAGAASVTTSWSSGNSQGWAMVGVSVKPAVSASLLTLGVGV